MERILKRRDFLKRISAAGAAVALSGAGKFSAKARAQGKSRPNILFIMSDDHSLEAISAYQTELKDFAQTPVIDQLAAEGMRFNNVCCNYSLCSPSRAMHCCGLRTTGGPRDLW